MRPPQHDYAPRRISSFVPRLSTAHPTDITSQDNSLDGAKQHVPRASHPTTHLIYQPVRCPSSDDALPCPATPPTTHLRTTPTTSPRPRQPSRRQSSDNATQPFRRQSSDNATQTSQRPAVRLRRTPPRPVNPSDNATRFVVPHVQSAALPSPPIAPRRFATRRFATQVQPTLRRLVPLPASTTQPDPRQQHLRVTRQPFSAAPLS